MTLTGATLVDDHGQRDERRQGKAGCAGGMVVLVLCMLGGLAATRQIPGAGNWQEVMVGLMCVATFLVTLGEIVGWLGAAMSSVSRASMAGIVALGGFATVVSLIRLGSGQLNGLGPADHVWFVAAAGSLGSICGQVAWLVGGRAPNERDRPRPGQFTIRQVLAFFIPVALYFGYIRYLLER